MIKATGVSPKRDYPQVAALGGAGNEEEEVHDPEARSSSDGGPGGAKVASEPQEDAPIQIARDPGDPTLQEREEHSVTHVPYRSWCPVCVKAQGQGGGTSKQKRG